MSPAFLANLERSMRAFVALTAKLEQIGDDPEFRSIFGLSAIHGHQYGGPTWEKELLEAQECLREAQALAAGPQPAEPEVPGAAVSKGTPR